MRYITILPGLLLLMTATASRADNPPEVQAELKKLQGLWQDRLGGATHRDGEQTVMQPVNDGPCFFIRDDRLIWLTEDGKPSGREEQISLDVTANPKQIARTVIMMEGKEVIARPLHGIYEITDSGLRVQFGLDGAAPKQFLEVNKAVKGVNGTEWIISRKKLGGKYPSATR